MESASHKDKISCAVHSKVLLPTVVNMTNEWKVRELEKIRKIIITGIAPGVGSL
jgi:hypothetical protein